MSEIDKMINQAFPEELRKVTPISVDEEKVAALTFQKLGLERSPAEPEVAEKSRGRGRYVMRHGKQKPEPQLVEVPMEPVRPLWRTLTGWAVAACLLVCCGVWGPRLIRSLPWERPSASSEAYAGGIITGGVEAGGAGNDEGITEGGTAENEWMDEDTVAGTESAKLVDGSAADGLNGIMAGSDLVVSGGQETYGAVRVSEVTDLNDQGHLTVTVLFPGYTAGEVSNFSITLWAYGDAQVHVATRENFAGRARVTFQFDDYQEEPTVADLLVVWNDHWDDLILGYYVYIVGEGEDTFIEEFSKERYANYGYTIDGSAATLDDEPMDRPEPSPQPPAATDSHEDTDAGE